MLQKKILNFEDLIEAKDYSDEFFEKFKENKTLINIYKKNQNNLRFDFPEIMDNIINIITNSVTLVGGGRNECLAEIALLLEILSIDYKINESLTY